MTETDLEAAGLSRERALKVLDDLGALHQWAYGLFLQGEVRSDPSPLNLDAMTIVSVAIGEGPPWTDEAVQRALERMESRQA
jgi:hypothetical protein